MRLRSVFWPWRMLLAGIFALVVQTSVAQEAAMVFDIPAQPLDQALYAFGATSGFQVFYETALTAGRRSTEVKGLFDRKGALTVLLLGTNLTARAIAPNTITITATDAVSSELLRAKRASVSYYGAMQLGVLRALCRDPKTRPGHYRAVIQLWIDPEGQIAQIRLIGQSGDTGLDSAIARSIRAIAFQRPLPDIPQPVTLLIEPSSSVQLDNCAATNQTAVH